MAKKRFPLSRSRVKKAVQRPRATVGVPAATTVKGTPSAGARVGTQPRWTFLTNHGHVLMLLFRHPTIVLRQVAMHVGITERAVQRIITDLEEGGFIAREKIGRQNRYSIRLDRPLRHSIEAHRTIGDLVGLIDQEPSRD